VAALRWVFQEHQASRHHYDLRLEVDGVLKSWAVPRGPSMNTRVRRLAQPVPDHEMDQLLREGPEGPGRGTIVWDTGTYTMVPGRTGAGSVAAALAAGHLKVVLEGNKLRGGFALTRTRPPPSERWIWVKMRDDLAASGEIAVEQPASVLSGRTLADLLHESLS